MSLTEDQRHFAAHILGVLGGRLWRSQHPEETGVVSVKSAEPAVQELPPEHYLNGDTERQRRQFAQEILNGDWPGEDWNR